jgi:phosphohistidine phosphatase
MGAKRRVWLLRHAKSSWDDPTLADEDRPLAPRGVRAAAAMATHLASLEHPRLVLCSSGLRARQTLAAILPALGPDLVAKVEPGLYTFEADVLLERLRLIEDDTPSVMLVGHNPALQELALRLSAASDIRTRLEERFPTAALLTIGLPADRWTSVREGTGHIERLVLPKDLVAG